MSAARAAGSTSATFGHCAACGRGLRAGAWRVGEIPYCSAHFARGVEELVLEVATDYATYIQARLDDGSWEVAPEVSPESSFLEAVAALRALRAKVKR